MVIKIHSRGPIIDRAGEPFGGTLVPQQVRSVMGQVHALASAEPDITVADVSSEFTFSRYQRRDSHDGDSK